ncbi:peptidase M28 family protein, partial [Lysobacter maris]
MRVSPLGRTATLAIALAAALVVAAPVVIGTANAGEAESTIPAPALDSVAGLREQALASDLGYRITESLTTEVGPRLAGSEADARAVAWAVAKFKALGYDKVWTEPVTFPKWERRSESARIVGANAQPLTVTALGGSPAGTVEAEVVRFADLAALEAAPAGSLAGKIAFIDYRMERARDGRGYGPGSRV